MNNAAYRPSRELVLRKIGEEAILIPVRNRVGDLDSVFTLNEVAARIWSLLDGARSIPEIVSTVALEYEVNPAEAEADVNALLHTLEDAGLVEPVPDR